MKIISKFKDYYDCIQAQGQDLTCLWVRECRIAWEEFERDDIYYKLKLTKRCYLNKEGISYCSLFIGFCGHIYPLLKVKYYKNFKEIDSCIAYNKEDVFKFASKYLKHRQLQKFYENEDIKFYQKVTVNNLFYVNTLDLTKLFLKYKTPIFIGSFMLNEGKHRCKLIIHNNNENLKHLYNITLSGKYDKRKFISLQDLEFYRIIDTYTAFQEIHMYLSGVLGVNNPHVPEMDNQTKIDTKGFDKWSFRKESTK